MKKFRNYREKDIENVLQKLEPYVKSGLSVRKSCNVCGIPESSFYHFAKKYPWFLERIELFQTYQSVLLSNIFHQKLEQLHHKFVVEGIEPTKQEWRFMQWFALNAKSCSNLFGKTTFIKISDKADANISEVLDRLEEEAKKEAIHLH